MLPGPPLQGFAPAALAVRPPFPQILDPRLFSGWSFSVKFENSSRKKSHKIVWIVYITLTVQINLYFYRTWKWCACPKFCLSWWVWAQICASSWWTRTNPSFKGKTEWWGNDKWPSVIHSGHKICWRHYRYCALYVWRPEIPFTQKPWQAI